MDIGSGVERSGDDYESSYQIKYYDYSGKSLRMLDLGDEYSAWSYGMEPV